MYSTQSGPPKSEKSSAQVELLKVEGEHNPELPVDKKLQLPVPKTKEYFLKRATGWWQRLAVRLKWSMIRSYRPFNWDELSALFSWVLWGHILWVVLGTTTFLSLIVWVSSKFRMEDFAAKLAGRIVTKETGLQVVFEEAIVPDWKQGVIVLNKVFISRRPGGHQSVAKGAQPEPVATAETEEPEGNYTQFDITVEHMAVTLSVSRWLQGKGILKTVDVKGVRGVVDRRFLVWDPNYDATLHRRKHKRGEFDWEQCRLEDLLVTVMQKNGPSFQVGVYNCELPRLRRQWLLYDLLNASNMSGSFDNSMFTLHPRQQFGDRWGASKLRVQRLRMDSVDVRHLNRGVSGMFGWIDSGTVDFLADIVLPPAEVEPTYSDKWADITERWKAQLKGERNGSSETSVQRRAREKEESKIVAIDLRVQFNNTRASAPLYSRDLNALNNAIIHPIVAYINSRDTYIPIHCHVAKRLSDFDGAWTIYDSGLMQALSNELYVEFTQDVADDEARSRRIKKVGFWSLQFLAQLVLLTLGIVA